MKFLFVVPLLVFTVACGNKQSGVSSSNVESNRRQTTNKIVDPQKAVTGIQCILSSDNDRTQFFIKGMEGQNITVHEVVLGTLSYNTSVMKFEERTLPMFKITDRDEKGSTIAEAEEKFAENKYLSSEEYPGNQIKGYRWKLIIPNKAGGVGYLQRGAVLKKKEGFLVFGKRNKAVKDVARVVECHGEQLEPEAK